MDSTGDAGPRDGQTPETPPTLVHLDGEFANVATTDEVLVNLHVGASVGASRTTPGRHVHGVTARLRTAFTFGF